MRLLTSIRQCIVNRCGSSFVLVLLLMLILTVLGMSLLGMSVSNLRMSDADRDYQSVFYIAESGRNYVVEGLGEVAQDTFANVENASGFFDAMDDYFSDPANISVPGGVFDSQFGEAAAVTVTVEGIGGWSSGDTEHTYTIVSEGHIGGVKRQVVSHVTFSYVLGVMQGSYISDVALFSQNDISVTEGSRVYGPIGTNSVQNGAINLSGTTDVTNILIRSGADSVAIFSSATDYNNYKNKLNVMQEERTFPLPEYPDIPSPTYRGNLTVNSATNISADGRYNTITVQSGATLTIDTGGGTRELVVGQLKLTGGGRIAVTGSGMLNLYVTGTFTLDNGTSLNMGGNDRKVMIYYSGTDTFSPCGGGSCVASVYVKTANIDFTNEFSVTGHIVSGGNDIHFAGSSSSTGSMIYAPNAALRMDNCGIVKGAVIVESCHMVGGSSITYNPDVTMGDVPGITFPFTAPTIEFDIGKPTERDY